TPHRVGRESFVPHVYEITCRYTVVAKGPSLCGMLDAMTSSLCMSSSLRGLLSRSLERVVPSWSALRPEVVEAAQLSEDTLGSLVPLVPTWPGATQPLEGGRLNVRHAGDGSPPGAVYVHGLGGSATNWTDLQALLTPGTPGAAIDLPGFGFSEPASGFDFTLTAHARVLEQYIVRSTNAPIHLVGNSMGGTIALLTAARRPDLVRSLTLVSPAMPDRRPDPRRLSDPRLPLAYLPAVGGWVRRSLARPGPSHRVR